MVLKDKYNNKSYYCKLTEDLDHCAGFDKKLISIMSIIYSIIEMSVDFIISQFVFLVVQLVEFG